MDINRNYTCNHKYPTKSPNIFHNLTAFNHIITIIYHIAPHSPTIFHMIPHSSTITHIFTNIYRNFPSFSTLFHIPTTITHNYHKSHHNRPYYYNIYQFCSILYKISPHIPIEQEINTTLSERGGECPLLNPQNRN